MLCVAQMSALCAPHRGHLLGSAVSPLGKGDPGPGMGLVLSIAWHRLGCQEMLVKRRRKRRSREKGDKQTLEPRWALRGSYGPPTALLLLQIPAGLCFLELRHAKLAGYIWRRPTSPGALHPGGLREGPEVSGVQGFCTLPTSALVLITLEERDPPPSH